MDVEAGLRKKAASQRKQVLTFLDMAAVFNRLPLALFCGLRFGIGCLCRAGPIVIKLVLVGIQDAIQRSSLEVVACHPR